MDRVSEPAADAPRRRAGAAILVPAAVLAAALDALFVLVFATLGRAEHGGGAVEPAAIWEAAWPFLAALAVVWAAALIWRQPFAVLRSGLPVWIGTVVLGLVLRVVFTEGGAALPFVLVATGVLGLTLVGWRLIALPVRRVRRVRRVRARR